MTVQRHFRPRALGEIAIRCSDLDAMTAFYRDVLGLEPIEGGFSDDIRFFKIAEGVAGHTAVLALFRHDGARADGPAPNDGAPDTGVRSSLHHIALSLPFAEQDAVMAWYDHLGLAYNVQTFGWIGWRGIFTKDPEGNTVELVAYDASLRD